MRAGFLNVYDDHARAAAYYRLVPDGDVGGLSAHRYDLVFSAFTFDNVPTMEKKVVLFRSLRLLLKSHGRILNLESTPDIYLNEWASFSTRAHIRGAQCQRLSPNMSKSLEGNVADGNDGVAEVFDWYVHSGDVEPPRRHATRPWDPDGDAEGRRYTPALPSTQGVVIE